MIYELHNSLTIGKGADNGSKDGTAQETNNKENSNLIQREPVRLVERIYVGTLEPIRHYDDGKDVFPELRERERERQRYRHRYRETMGREQKMTSHPLPSVLIMHRYTNR